MTQGPVEALRAIRRAGHLKTDPAQELAAEKLQSLHHALLGYRAQAGKRGWKARFGLDRGRGMPPLGLYISGPVGRGKSMLMDMFFQSAPVEQKRRVHFHAFMQEIHDRAHALRQQGAGEDPVVAIARQIVAEATLLCFDEFQVDNIADAMILGRLFQQLFDLGVVVVATSNTPPDALYKDGLQRELFLPFIALIKDRLDLLELDGGIDHRIQRLRGRRVYHVPADAAAERALDQAFADLTDGAAGGPQALEVKGRRVQVPRVARGVARFAFPELCEQPLGPADYLAIATHFHTLVLDRVPKMRPEQRNVARRFITLIDALYEHRVNLICSADGEPGELYGTGDGARMFLRTASRLIEMQARHYLDSPHLT
ncbi:MAG: cell division protein ZapE [Alphaproteobacteria bacterium]|nr:cell division protein ZapE [Alphaproteobacteria bacterium]